MSSLYRTIYFWSISLKSAKNIKKQKITTKRENNSVGFVFRVFPRPIEKNGRKYYNMLTERSIGYAAFVLLISWDG
jgi:hypothetical protein